MTPQRLKQNNRGVIQSERARIADPSGSRHTPLGSSDFESLLNESFFVDKSELIKDVIDGALVTLFCRPRRFGKSLAMSMMKAFFEIPLDGVDRSRLFEGLGIWDKGEGDYRKHQGRYPVVSFTLSQAKQMSWAETLGDIGALVVDEYSRHSYLVDSAALTDEERAYCKRVTAAEFSDAELRISLKRLVSFLYRHYGSPCVILIDKYDAPVMAGDTYGYRDEATTFMRAWLTAAIKDGGASVFRTCLTGVQRVTGESLFSDLNNVMVNTTLNTSSSERFGFTRDEVGLLAEYLGHPESVIDLNKWYDGYRFGKTDIYNPWSVLCYFYEGCRPAPYWVNTSSNTLLARVLERADQTVWDSIVSLLESGGTIEERLNLNVVYKDVDADQGSLWSLLYLSGYLTTDDTDAPDDRRLVRRLRLPNLEISHVFMDEIIDRYESRIGARDLTKLQECVVKGDERGLQESLQRLIDERMGFFELENENSCHNLLFGLLVGTRGYDVFSERKRGIDRCDICLTPNDRAPTSSPVVIIELKWLNKYERSDDVVILDERLCELAREALAQITHRGYDVLEVSGNRPHIRIGFGFAPTRVAVQVEKVGSTP